MSNNRISITSYNESKGYVFISYSSKNRETVINDFLIPLQYNYGLRLYFDQDFQNDATTSWTNQMKRNLINSDACLVFLSNTYLCSYACLLEVLNAITNKKPILVILLEKIDLSNLQCDDKEQTLSHETVKNFKDQGKWLKRAVQSLYPQAKEALDCYKNVMDNLKTDNDTNTVRIATSDIALPFEVLIKSITGLRINGSPDENTIKGIRNSLKNCSKNNNKVDVFDESKTNRPVDESVQQNTIVPDPEKNNSVHTSKTDVPKPAQETVNANENKSADKIGAFISNSMKALQDKGYRFTDKMLSDLLDAEYSKEVFHLSYPFFVDDKSKIRDDKGRNRYWTIPFSFNGKTLYLTSQWFEKQRVFFENWYNSLSENADNTSETNEDKPSEKKDRNQDFGFSVYGEKFTGNQNLFMQRVFEKVMKKHENIVNQLIDADYMDCLSHGDRYTNSKSEKSYFRTCEYYQDIAGGVSVGTAYGKPDKAKKIACLLLYCSESVDIIGCDDETIMNEIKSRYEYYSRKIPAI